MFYLKEFWFHYKFTPLACFLVKYRGHECIMIRPVPPPCCLWVMRLSCHHCRWVGPGLYWRAIISPRPWWAVGPFLSCLARCLVIQAGHVSWVVLSLPVPLGSPVGGLTSFVGCDVLWGPSFPNYLLHCNSW